MPIPNPPYKIACHNCGWSTYRPGHSDVISPEHRQLLIGCCAKCGSKDLEMRQLSVIEQALVAPIIEIAEALRRRVR